MHRAAVYETPDGPAEGLDRRFDPSAAPRSRSSVVTVRLPPAPTVRARSGAARRRAPGRIRRAGRGGVVSVSQALDTEAPWTRPSSPRRKLTRPARSCYASAPAEPADRSDRRGERRVGRSSTRRSSTGNRVQFRSFSRQVVGGAWIAEEKRASRPVRFRGGDRSACARRPHGVLRARPDRPTPGRSASSRRRSSARPTSTWSSARRTSGKTRR